MTTRGRQFRWNSNEYDGSISTGRLAMTMPAAAPSSASATIVCAVHARHGRRDSQGMSAIQAACGAIAINNAALRGSSENRLPATTSAPSNTATSSAGPPRKLSEDDRQANNISTIKQTASAPHTCPNARLPDAASNPALTPAQPAHSSASEDAERRAPSCSSESCVAKNKAANTTHQTIFSREVRSMVAPDCVKAPETTAATPSESTTAVARNGKIALTKLAATTRIAACGSRRVTSAGQKSCQPRMAISAATNAIAKVAVINGVRARGHRREATDVAVRPTAITITGNPMVSRTICHSTLVIMPSQGACPATSAVLPPNAT